MLDFLWKSVIEMRYNVIHSNGINMFARCFTAVVSAENFSGVVWRPAVLGFDI